MKQNEKIYVTMTDKFLSGWGMAAGKINKLIFECDTWEEAQIVEENAKNRSEMKDINIATKKPYYTPKKYYAQMKDKNEYPNWYEKGYFK